MIEAQRAGCEAAGSPLYATILDAVGTAVATDGPARRVFAPCAGATFGDAVVLRLLAGVHDLVLAGRAPELARHYPSVGGTPGADVGEVFLRVVATHEDEVTRAMTRPVQTNEVGRSVALLCGLLAVATPDRPLRIFEVGASAGLNLWFDRYRYEADGWSLGPVDASLRFVDPFGGRPPASTAMPVVVERRGCDLEPIDPETDVGRRRLRSFVWADQQARRDRLDRAIDAIGDGDPVVDRASAPDWIASRLARPEAGATTVVVHSIVLQYLPIEERRRFVETVEAAGEAATVDAPVAWLRMEPAGDHAETRLTTWPGGRTSVVATSGYHGPPVRVVHPDR